MIPAGYLAKRVSGKPDYLKVDNVVNIYSVSNCISNDFADYINFWRHNGYWLFNSPEVIEEVATANSIDLADTKIFYYEVYEFQFDADQERWISFESEKSFSTEVLIPANKNLEGYDVVNFTVGTNPECSPLSCNYLASSIRTNSHCLIDSFDEAKVQVESGKFSDSEPGPYRIFAVYSVGP